MMNQISEWPEPDKQKLLTYLGWSCLLSEKHKLLYIATPKVACTSLKWWFAELEGFSDAIRQSNVSAESDPDLIIHDTFFKIAPAVAGLPPEALFEPITSTEYFRFAVVRNPYKRIFSAWQSKLLLREPLQIGPYVNCDFYHHKIGNSTDIAKAFEGFLEHLAKNETPNYLDVHWTPQVDLLRPDLINYSKLVKIENANELSTALSKWLGAESIDPFATRSANESLIPYLPELITQRSIELMHLLFAKDFEAFGYSEQLPEAKEEFSVEQFKIAIKAIDIIRGRHQRLGEIRNRISAECKESIASLNNIATERENQIANISQALAECNNTIDNLNQTLVERNGKIIDLMLDQKRILNSMSWKITKPLRFIKNKLKNKV